METQQPTIGEVLLAVGRLEGKMDAVTLLQATQKEHDKRLGSLEKSRAWTIGFVAPVVAVLGWIAPSYFGKG